MIFSVVIPTRNEERFIVDCIQSVQVACGQDCKIIVVDNGSTDATVQLARAAGAQVITDPRPTIAAQRNLGASAAEGEVFAFLDADCTVGANWATAALSVFEDPEVVSAGAPPHAPLHNASWVQAGWIFLKRKPSAQIRQVTWLASCNVWVRKAAFQTVGGFDETFETCEDADLGFRLAEIGKIISNPAIHVDHHREPRTLNEFYRKEVWHGKNSFDGLMKGRFTPAELPSLVAPLICAFGFCLAIVAGLFTLVGWQMVALIAVVLGGAAMLVVPAAYTFRAHFTKGKWHHIHHSLIIYCVYFAARTDALLRWLGRSLTNARRSI